MKARTGGPSGRVSRMATRVGMVSVLALGLGGCVVGPGSHASAVAREPGGLRATITMDGVPQRRAELLALEEASLLVLTHSGLATVALDRIRAVDLGPYGEIDTPFSPSERDRLRLLCRFPYGLPDGVLDEILRQNDQEAAEEW